MTNSLHSNDQDYAMIEFNMSRINSVYGNSNTVMPNSIDISIIIYLGK